MGLIYLDSCLVIYLVENHPRWGERITGAIAQAEAARFSISSLVKCECLVGPMKRGDPVLERAYSELFDQFALLPLPDPVYLHAARLRAFRPEDAGRSPSRLCSAPWLRSAADERRPLGATLARAGF